MVAKTPEVTNEPGSTRLTLVLDDDALTPVLAQRGATAASIGATSTSRPRSAER